MATRASSGLAAAATQTAAVVGLSETEAAARLRARGPVRAPRASRSLASIVRANVLTVFNAILAAFGAVTLVFGDARDALFLGIIVANATIGITQEARAKRALDRLAPLVAPRALAVRDGVERELAAGGVVRGDLLRGAPRRSDRRRRRARRRTRAAARRIDADRRVRARPPRGRRQRALGRFRRRGHRRPPRRRGRRRQLRRATRRTGALVSPSALAARTGRQPSAVLARRARRGSRRPARLLAVSPARVAARGRRDLDRRRRQPDPRGADGARQPDLRRRRCADGAAWRARAAAQRDRVARLGRRFCASTRPAR